MTRLAAIFLTLLAWLVPQAQGRLSLPDPPRPGEASPRPGPSGLASRVSRGPNGKWQEPGGLANDGFRHRDLSTGTYLSPDPAGFINGHRIGVRMIFTVHPSGFSASAVHRGHV